MTGDPEDFVPAPDEPARPPNELPPEEPEKNGDDEDEGDEEEDKTEEEDPNTP